eukprot:CAMPEP_0194065366 /NCGR_PEP_ID=MMETSP0009_2-20130614/85430_1 /TAXON_ID=210454 /ORGANISM="Grammatophora oceanica, Strain CCMP 410" /LENGTH=197 /DNA_ID=CAMNT_0038718205 /DNA_START=367 /DNA_END=959 /DNA_ORIENTATION=-
MDNDKQQQQQQQQRLRQQQKQQCWASESADVSIRLGCNRRTTAAARAWTTTNNNNNNNNNASGSSSAGRQSPPMCPLGSGATVGCGVEVLGSRRVFFTHTGNSWHICRPFGLDFSDTTTLPLFWNNNNNNNNNKLNDDRILYVKGSDRLSLIPPTERLAEAGVFDASSGGGIPPPVGSAASSGSANANNPPVYGRTS